MDTGIIPKTEPISNPPHATPDTATPPNFISYTQAMFGKYDFRLWDDFQELDSLAGVTLPPWSYPAQIAGSYRGFATKQSILSLAAESYIQVVEDWQPPVPVSLLRAQRLFSKPKFTHAFNIKGQRLRTEGAPTLMIRKLPGGP